MGKIWMPGGGDSDISNTKITTAENITTEFPVPEPGDAVKTFLGKMKKFTEDFKDLKTGLLTMGMLVNNCVTDDKNLPLSAAQGKKLMDLFTQLNGERIPKLLNLILNPSDIDTIFATYKQSHNNYSGWLPYVAMVSNKNFLILGYETENGYGAQIKISHLGGIPILQSRRKTSGTWHNWE